MDPSANTTAAAATTTTTAITTTTATVLFGGEVTSVRVLLNLLKAIQIKNIVTVNIYDEGITFTAEETRSAKAVAYLKRHLFQSYRKQMSAGEIEPFGVGLSTLVDSLSMLSLGGGSVTADTCRIRYAGEGAPLELIREDKEMDASTQCRLVTLDPDPESMELSISDGPTLIDRAIMKSSWLKDALSDLDRTCERVTLTFSPEDPCFVLQGDGANGSFQMEYPENSQSFVSFQCDHEVSFSYHYSHIMLCTKALDQSDEVSMRVSQDGVLGMLFRIQTLNQESYVEFTIIPFESSSAS